MRHPVDAVAAELRQAYETAVNKPRKEADAAIFRDALCTLAKWVGHAHVEEQRRHTRPTGDAFTEAWRRVADAARAVDDADENKRQADELAS